MTDELKPCPFCGATARHWTRRDNTFPYEVEHYIMCDRCNAKVGEYTTERGAKKGWNRRVSDGTES